MPRNLEELRPLLKDVVERTTEKSKGNMYICPFCSSGTGKNKTGAFGIYDNGVKWKCQACQRQGDVFDYVGELEHLQTLPEQIAKVEDLLNLAPNQEIRSTPKSVDEIEITSFVDFYNTCQKKLKLGGDYHRKRGLSDSIAEKYGLGYEPSWKHPKAQNVEPSPRLIIPITEYSYIARDTRENIPKEAEPYKKSKAKGKPTVIWTFNYKVLDHLEKPLFIVEGEIDALSIIEVGGEAVGLGSISNVNGFLSLLEGKKIEQPFVIALDNEEGENVKKATQTLEAGLDQLGIKHTRAEGYGTYKDANEMLVADRDGLTKMVKDNEVRAIAEAEITEIAKAENYLKENSALYDLRDFINGVEESVNTPPTPTGFKHLDEILDGGLYEGLYFIGGISSLGKTTFALQVADQIARIENKDVMIITLEMDKKELIAKSVSRETYLYTKEAEKPPKLAKTNRGITNKARYKDYGTEDLFVIENAYARYGDYAEHIYFKVGVGDITTEQIRTWIKEHQEARGTTPILVIDYLQIMAPPRERMTDKQAVDNNVMELKRISRDFKTPVLAVSSVNRSNYLTPIDFEAFKESGAIEFSADVVIGLQLACLDGELFYSDKKVKEKRESIARAKKENPRKIQAVILKNRNGQTGDAIEYKYYPRFNFLEECGVKKQSDF